MAIDIQAMGGMVQWTVNGITIILMIIASSLAVKKNNNLCLGVAIVGNLAVYYLTQSPLLCWMVSIACMIWASKSGEQGQSAKKTDAPANKQKIAGHIIGLLIGIGLLVAPIMAYVLQEASTKDPTSQGIMILSGVIGAFMIINNTFSLFERQSSAAPAASAVKASKEEPQNATGKIRCRFCKKLYSSEYNGCPYCKKK